MKLFLIAFLGILLLLPQISFAACPAAVSAKELLLEYPVIIGGTFAADKTFKPGIVFKGSRKRLTIFDTTENNPFVITPNRPALVLATFRDNRAVLDGCSKIIYEGEKVGDVTYAALLAEATVYEATARIKGSRLPLESDKDREYSIISSFFRESRDFVYLLEIASDTIIYAAERDTSDSFTHDTWQQCTSEVSATSSYLPDRLKNALSKPMVIHGSNKTFRQAVSDFAEILINMGEYNSALYAVCSSDAANLYIEAALKAGRPDLINGKRFGNVINLSNLDLTGLNLRGLRARGEWKNLRVDGTDFTGASFEQASFDGVNIEDATLNFVTYSCKTVFPTGFDPVARHMIQNWHLNGCKDTEPPAIDLEGVVLRANHQNPSGTKEEKVLPRHELPLYKFSKPDEPVFIHVAQLDKAKAKNTNLGAIICYACVIRASDFAGSKIQLSHGSGGLRIYGSTFQGADLRGSDISGTELRNVDFTGADLRGAALVNVQLYGVNFSGAKLEDTKFNYANYDATTTFPASFDPVKAGMTKMTE